MREVQNKWQTLKMNDDIWAKLIYFEQNRRLAKAYVSTPVLTIDGSTSGLDGFRIGLSGIENTYRSLDSIASLRSIGQGIKLKIDGDGNILIRRIGSKASGLSCSIWVKDWPPANADAYAYTCSSPMSSSSLSDSYTSAGSSSSSSSTSSASPYIENWNIKKLPCEHNEENSFKLFDMNKFRAQLERQRRQQYSGLRDGEQRQLVDWRQCVSIICFVRNNIPEQASGTQLTKQLIAEDKLNRNPQRILKEPCWLMLINIIAIDMLKSLLCDNKSNIRPALPMKILQQNNNNRYELKILNKNSGPMKSSLAQQNSERANSRILERDEDEVENNGIRYPNHRNQSSTSINKQNISYDNYSSRVTTARDTAAKRPGARLKSSSSVASLHPSGGDKLSSSSSGTHLADYLLFPTGNLINYFSNGRKHTKPTSSGPNGRQSSNGNLFSLSKQTTGLSSANVSINNKFNEQQSHQLSDSQRQVDDIYSKSDYIKFNSSSDSSRGLDQGQHSSSQQHLNYGLNGLYSATNYADYNQESNLEDEDAIYTTFTGKYLYNNGKNRRAQLDEATYSIGSRTYGNNGSTVALNKRQSSSSLYPVDSMQSQTKLAQPGKSATLGQQSRSSFDLSHGHKLDLRQLKTPTSIKMNFESDEDSPIAASRKQVNDTTLRSRRALNAFNKKATEWSRLAKRFAMSGKSSASRISSTQQDLDRGAKSSVESESKYCTKNYLGKDEHAEVPHIDDNSASSMVNQKKISRSSIVSSSSSSGCPENDYFHSQSSMSSSSSTERSTTNDGDVLSSSQPASSSGIVCSGNTSDDCCGGSSEGNGKKAEQNIDNVSHHVGSISNNVPPKKTSAQANARIQRKAEALSGTQYIDRRLMRSVSKNRYNNVKILDGPQIDCNHYEEREIECDCQDCGYEQQGQLHSQEAGDFTSCDCCCDCFYNEPSLPGGPPLEVLKNDTAAATTETDVTV